MCCCVDIFIVFDNLYSAGKMRFYQIENAKWEPIKLKSNSNVINEYMTHERSF